MQSAPFGCGCCIHQEGKGGQNVPPPWKTVCPKFKKRVPDLIYEASKENEKVGVELVQEDAGPDR